MKRLVLVVLLAGIAHADQKAPGKPVQVKLPPLPPSTDDLLIADLAKAAWTPAEKMGMPAGAQMALIGQDPTTTGQTVYLKTPGGYKLPAHASVHGAKIVMVSGKGTFTVAGKKVPVVAGSYLSLPPKTPHDFACDAGGECVVIIQHLGPTDLNWVKPAK